MCAFNNHHWSKEVKKKKSAQGNLARKRDTKDIETVSPATSPATLSWSGLQRWGRQNYYVGKNEQEACVCSIILLGLFQESVMNEHLTPRVDSHSCACWKAGLEVREERFSPAVLMGWETAPSCHLQWPLLRVRLFLVSVSLPSLLVRIPVKQD